VPSRNYVVARDQPVDVGLREHLIVGDDGHVRVERPDGLGRGLGLLLTHPVGGVDDLALEVGHIDDIEVDHTDGAHAGRGKVEQARGTQAAGADEQRLRAQQPGLTFRTDLGDEQVAAVALLLLATQHHGRGPRQAGGLPGLEATAHGCHIGVAHLLRVWAANSDRVPPAQYNTRGSAWSGAVPPICCSR